MNESTQTETFFLFSFFYDLSREKNELAANLSAIQIHIEWIPIKT